MSVRRVQLTKRTKPSFEIEMMFDTGAATHVCPWWFGEQFTTYKYKGAGAQLVQRHRRFNPRLCDSNHVLSVARERAVDHRLHVYCVRGQ